MRFLVVDDEPTSCELLRGFLSPYGNCDLAFDGREAIEAVRLALEQGRPYDLVCLDIMMGSVDGHEALQAIRLVEAQRGVYGADGTKIIMTTSLRDSKHIIRSFREGCESYINKPVKQSELLARMRDLGLDTTIAVGIRH